MSEKKGLPVISIFHSKFFAIPHIHSNFKTAIREVMAMIEAAPEAKAAAALIALDRQEKGQGELSAIQEVERDFGIKVVSIVNLNQVLDYVSSQEELKVYAGAIEAYRAQYGVS